MRRVYILEDDPLLRQLLVAFITEHTASEVVGSADDGSVGMKEIRQLRPDLLILDIHVPEVSGLEVLFLARRQNPDVRCIIFSGIVNAKSVRIAVDGKADAFVEKGGSIDELIEAFHAVDEGRTYYSPSVVPFLQDRA